MIYSNRWKLNIMIVYILFRVSKLNAKTTLAHILGAIMRVKGRNHAPLLCF